jgi:hypothetical protein
MDVNKLNTYACIKATAISNPVINITINIGNVLKYANVPPAVNIVQQKPDKIANNK